MTHTELVFRGTFGHILVAYIKKVVCQPRSVLKKKDKHSKLWLTDRLDSLGYMILRQDAFFNRDGDLQSKNIYDAVSLVIWKSYSYVSAIQPRIFG